MTKHAVCLFALLAAVAGTAPAQLISIKTVPVAQADQFAIFPSRNLGMGSVSIAVADPLLDPFLNPAKGARLGAPYFFGSPASYSVSSGAGGGRTLPVAAAMRSGSWFGGLALALQQVDASRRDVFGPVFFEGDVVPQGSLNERSHGNQMAFAMLGKAVPEARLSFGGSIFWAGLNAIDGVDLLYAGSQGIKQFGHAVDLRLGLLKEWAGDRSLEALFLYDRLRMTHDVTYLEWFWDPGSQRTLQRPRLEHNRDWTDIWGLHLEYERPLPGAGWRIGWLATGNRMSHPKIPNYEIMSIPRDPGDSYAFNVGVGVSRTQGPATFGVDAIYEPIWSHTWADAEAPVATRLGGTIPAGGKTIENDFRFSNALVRIGVTRDLGRTAAVQLGLVVRSIHYWLAQHDNVQVSMRNQEEQWVEWTPTWGLGLRFPELEIRYQGRVTNGTGRPGVVPNRTGTWLDVGVAASNIIVAPSGPLTLGDVRVVTHQVSLSLPLW
ncbi:MAG: hypothetical protein HY705_09370 [Gemmatimonadetes bacterium]|nr:hypothetical protein [Gemmatimonadota bacterium]